MRLTLILLVLFSVLLSAGSQVLLKSGMTSDAVRAALETRQEPLRVALTIASSPFVLGGLFCFGLSAIVWLFVLARVPLSSAYPFVALGIAITVLAGRFIFGESISAVKATGVMLVLAGIVVVATSR